jgi:hypothetical protein
MPMLLLASVSRSSTNLNEYTWPVIAHLLVVLE